MLNETISAISTAHGKGGVAIIRISGEDALLVARRVFKLGVEFLEPRRSYYGEIMRDGEVIDDGILTYFKAPSSFTGEDVCEICCHGGIYVTEAVLQSVLSSGARLATAGEFTRRAYLNGKLTLSRAEAIGNVIDAKTDSQLKLSSSQARGVLSTKIEIIREKMLALISRAYAVVDYPDEDIEDSSHEEFKASLDFIVSELTRLKNSYHTGRAITEGIKTAIVGRPNAGKSSLYNLLLGEELAIVTDIAGTTRDVIEHTASLGGVTINLADTAGIRKTEDTVEKIGVERATKRLEDAELLLCVFDFSSSENDDDYFIVESAQNKNAVAIINKTDTLRGISLDFEEKIKKCFKHVVYLSAKNGEGLDSLSKTVCDMYSLGEIDISNDAIISNARQFSALSLALDEAIFAKNAFECGQTADVICFTLEKSLSELDMIDARGASEEIVNTIFSRFCVGK